MCFHISTKASTQSRNCNTPNELVDYYHVSGFDHPKLGVLYQDKTIISQWGLIPYWIKDEIQAISISNRTLNARLETVHSKPSFKDVCLNRGILFLDGFFEFKHENKKKSPYFIYSSSPIGIGIIISEWTNPQTGEIISSFSIVTNKASNILKQIHNNPKIKEPRSPLLIDLNNKNVWLNENNLNYLHKISGEIEENLNYHMVNNLSGKHYTGNSIKVLKPLDQQQYLF